MVADAIFEVAVKLQELREQRDELLEWQKKDAEVVSDEMSQLRQQRDEAIRQRDEARQKICHESCPLYDKAAEAGACDVNEDLPANPSLGDPCLKENNE